MTGVLLRRGLVVLAALAGAAASAEVGLRLALRLQGEPYDRVPLERRVKGAVSLVRGPAARAGDGDEPPPRFAHPFFGWETGRGFAGLQAEYADVLDGEVAERAATAALGEGEPFRVWLVGGSVAAIFTLKPHDASRYFLRLLEADPRLAGRRLELSNYGRTAFKAPQQLGLVGYLLTLGMRPDVVVNLDGFNEVAIAQANADRGAHPLYPSIEQWLVSADALGADVRALDLKLELRRLERGLEGLATFGLRHGVARSCVLGTLLDRRVKAIELEWRAARRRYSDYALEALTATGVSGPDLGEHAGRALELAVEGWYEASLSLHAQLAARGISYVHVLQPTLYDEGSKRLTPEEVAAADAEPSWIRGVREGYPLLRAAGARLVAEGVRFVDATDAFADLEETVYLDACHVGVLGNARLAERIAKAIRAAL